jgi:hypothetical protein
MKPFRRFANLMMLLLLLFSLSACGSGSTTPAESEPSQAPAPAAGQEAEEQPAKQLKVETLQVYYSDANLEELLPEQREISYDPEESEAKYSRALALLGEPREPEHEPLWANFAYHAVSFADGTLTIDASGENQYNLGAAGEAMALEALKRTMFQFPEVERIVILVDGKPADTLMGHADISQPLSR